MSTLKNKRVVRRRDLLYPDLSYSIVGALYGVFNELGPGHHEKYYQRAVAAALRHAKLRFKEQSYSPLRYRGVLVGKSFLDFIIESVVVLEIKKDNRFSKHHIEQVLGYLKSSGLKLTILANFTRQGVQFRRIVNIH